MVKSLKIWGRLVQVWIRDYLNNKENLEIAASITDHKPDFARNSWRAVCSLSPPSSPSLPQLISGWGSFEQLASLHTTNIYALHISTRNGDSLSVRVGSLTRAHQIYNVLYLEDITDDQHRRLRVGRIFETNVIEEFLNARDRTIELK
jgi:hypothetical protein